MPKEGSERTEKVRVWPLGCCSVAARLNAAASLLAKLPSPYFTFVEHLHAGTVRSYPGWQAVRAGNAAQHCSTAARVALRRGRHADPAGALTRQQSARWNVTRLLAPAS